MKKYKLVDGQGEGLKEDIIFNSKEEVRQNLILFHSQDWEGHEDIEKMDLNFLLEYGFWDIIEI